jgi:hypothetical protein
MKLSSVFRGTYPLLSRLAHDATGLNKEVGPIRNFE